jgi:hypothetical protein
MRFPRRGLILAAAAAAAVAVGAALGTQVDPGDLTSVANANGKTPGVPAPNVTSPELQLGLVAQGSMKLDAGPNPAVPYYGYDGDHTALVPSSLGSNEEATKTEPDENTYLVFDGGLSGPDSTYNYGTHFLFQGHEGGSPGYVTRINLDADAAHRVTLLASATDAGVNLRTIDGSMWDPWTQKLLFSTESASGGSIYQSTPDYPPHVVDLTKYTGLAAFEGMKNDDHGNIYMEEDAGGKVGAAPGDTTSAYAFTKQPNSFVYRFKPNDPTDLSKGGVLQALQVMYNGAPIEFTIPASSSDADVAAAANTDIHGANSAGYVALHTYGTELTTHWINILTTSSTTASLANDNALAKAAGATPFKRPENGNFRPGSKFREFYFDETGDTDNRTCGGGSPSAQAACASPNQTGGFGSIFKLVQSPTSDDGTISVLYDGDQTHAGFDNAAFFSNEGPGRLRDLRREAGRNSETAARQSGL